MFSVVLHFTGLRTEFLKFITLMKYIYAKVLYFLQDKLVPQKLPVCLTSQKLLPEKPLATVVAGEGKGFESFSREAIAFGLWERP